MDNLAVTPENVTIAAGQCSSTAGQIDQELSDLKAYVLALQAQWHGVASQNFGNLMTDYDIFGRMLHDALVDIGLTLQGNSGNYEETERTNISQLVAINGDIPGANL